ncbi:MAG: hypothetical protein AAFR64_07070 [Pseudomonadota bacterium]
MLTIRTTLRAATGIAALALTLPAAAQDDGALPSLPELPPVGEASVPVVAPAPVAVPMTETEVRTLPAEYQSMPVTKETVYTTVDGDGVETITRTRTITSSAPVETTYYQTVQPAAPAPQVQYHTTYAPAAYPAPAYAPMVLDREQWIAECERRTAGRSDDEKSGIIGALIGAVGGGIAGHELAAAGDALGGALIGGGVGALAGLAIGSLIGGDDDDEVAYDCEGVLDAYLQQHAEHGVRYASRSIPVAAPPVQAPPPAAYYPGYNYGYSYAPAPTYYQQQQTMVMVPVTTYQQQRVIVRETVREELVEVPGAARTIPPAPAPVPQPVPSPKLIKQAPAPVYAPAPSQKMIKN